MAATRPESLSGLGDRLCKLAWQGYAPSEPPLDARDPVFGRFEAVSVGPDNTEKFEPPALPAHTPKDLARRVAFRDPAYRIHLDLILARVLSRMARDGRTTKIDDYLSGKLAHLTPRLAWLLSLVPDPLADAHWSDLENKWLHPALQTSFTAWDTELFGDVLGGAEQLFPLIVEIYGPLGQEPTYARAATLRLKPGQSALLAELIRAAQEKEAVALADKELKGLNELALNFHLPIRLWKKTAGLRACAALVSPLRFLSPPPQDFSGSQVPPPFALPASLNQSSILPEDPPSVGSSLRRAALESVRAGAFPGFDLNSANVTDCLRFRSGSEQSEFDWTFDHPLFGLILQFFLVEAFGRELQDDCLNILYIGNPEDPESIDVYFRPESLDTRFVRLGHFDDTMRSLASALNIFTVPPPVDSAASRPWLRALLLLLQGGLLLSRSGEYMISDDLFDALHGQDFMKRVLRDGNPSRDRIIATCASSIFLKV
jgi:hypothetical protein